MIIIKNTKNKRANIPITLLVLMALVLTLAALYSFNTHVSRVSGEVKDSRFLDYIYSKENEVNFYINDIMEKAIAKTGTINPNAKSLFIDNFKRELLKYKKNQTLVPEELNQIEQQINMENIDINDKKISINLNIKIEKKFQDKFIISYLYNKKFLKVLNS